jgi:DNA-binding MarR family transcriptional regulator
VICCSLTEQTFGLNVECVSAAYEPGATNFLTFYPVNNGITDTEYIILENIYDSDRRNSPLKQRDLARIASASLGMTNSILKRLVQKGWVTAKKINSRNINYAVTMEGINEIIHRSYGYFKRTIKNIAVYKDAIDGFVQSAAEKQINSVLLVGTSDLEFIIEHSCHYYGLSFLKSADMMDLSEYRYVNILTVYSEDIPARSLKGASEDNRVYLSQLLIKLAAGPAKVL